jgi:hypothetical protein
VVTEDPAEIGWDFRPVGAPQIGSIHFQSPAGLDDITHLFGLNPLPCDHYTGVPYHRNEAYPSTFPFGAMRAQMNGGFSNKSQSHSQDLQKRSESPFF